MKINGRELMKMCQCEAEGRGNLIGTAAVALLLRSDKRDEAKEEKW